MNSLLVHQLLPFIIFKYIPQYVPQSSTVNINAENHVPFTQDHFLGNTENKSGMTEFISVHLKRKGFIVINCPDNADTTIVKKALP